MVALVLAAALAGAPAQAPPAYLEVSARVEETCVLRASRRLDGATCVARTPAGDTAPAAKPAPSPSAAAPFSLAGPASGVGLTITF